MNSFKRFAFATLTGCLSILSGCSSQTNTSGDDGLTIGIIQYAQHPALDDARDGFIDTLNANGYDDSTITISEYNAQNDPSNVETIANTLVNANVDLIYAIGTPAAQGVAAKTTTIPIIISAVTDPAASGLVETNDLPNTNISGTSDASDASVLVDLLMEIVPDATTVGIMYCSSEDNSAIQAQRYQTLLNEKGVNVEIFTVSDSASVQSVAESANGKVDAMMIPTDNLMAQTMPLVASTLNSFGIPTIVGEPALVENGGLTTEGIDYYQLGVESASMAIDVLNGTDISTMPIYFAPKDQLQRCFNTDTIAALGLTIDPSLMENATLYPLD